MDDECDRSWKRKFLIEIITKIGAKFPITHGSHQIKSNQMSFRSLTKSEKKLNLIRFHVVFFLHFISNNENVVTNDRKKYVDRFYEANLFP